MAKLKHAEWREIENYFDMQGGYVLDFSNKTFAEFFEDELGVDIYSYQFAENGNSKANRLRTYLKKSSPRQASKALRLLWKYKNRSISEELRIKAALVASSAMDPEELEFSALPHEIEADDFEKFVQEIENRDQALAVAATRIAAVEFNLDTVHDEIERASAFIDDDPEDAITAACSLLEAVCKSILVELAVPLPRDKSLISLYKEVRQPLGLSASDHTQDTETSEDVRTILSGIANAVKGIAALRTHTGDAHGRTRGTPRVDARIARLAVNSACGFALFLIETWARKYPDRRLLNAN